MERSVVHNSAGPGLTAFNSWVGLLRCQFSNASGDRVAFYGGVLPFSTIARWPSSWPWARSAAQPPLCQLGGEATYPPLVQMRMTNSIVTGYDEDMVMGQALEGDSITPLQLLLRELLDAHALPWKTR